MTHGGGALAVSGPPRRYVRTMYWKCTCVNMNAMRDTSGKTTSFEYRGIIAIVGAATKT